MQKRDEKEVEEGKKQENTKRRAKDFTKQNAIDAYKALINKYKATHARVHSILTSKDVTLIDDNYTFVITTNSSTQETAVKNVRTEIIEFLKGKLQNDFIKVIVDLKKEKVKQEKKLYTQKDKYNFLKEKNSKLDLLQKEFNLDFS